MEGGNGASEGCEGGELQIPRGYSLENEIRSICEQWITVLVSTWRLSLASFEKRSGSLNELDIDLSELLSRTETQMEEKHLGVETKLSRMCTTEKKERESPERRRGKGFPGGSGVKNPPASARDAGSVPDPRRSHILQSPGTTAIELCSRAQELQLPGPYARGSVLRNKRSHGNEKPGHHNH